MKGYKDVSFVRFGNLSPVKHKEHRLVKYYEEWECSDYHVSPRYKGFYAFPRGYISTFLLSGTTSWCRFFLDENGRRVSWSDFYNYDENNKAIVKPEYMHLIKKRHIRKNMIHPQKFGDEFWIIYMPHPKRFKYNGYIWSHLEDFVKEEDIIERERRWIKTTFNVYCKALRRSDIHDRFRTYMESEKYDDMRHGDPHNCPIYHDLDHYEVFIERL